MAKYAKRVRAATLAELRGPGVDGADADHRSVILLAKPWLHRDEDKIPAGARAHVAHALAISPRLAMLVGMREKLRLLWSANNASADQLVLDLQSWLREAEQSGVASLQEFALRLRSAGA